MKLAYVIATAALLGGALPGSVVAQVQADDQPDAGAAITLPPVTVTATTAKQRIARRKTPLAPIVITTARKVEEAWKDVPFSFSVIGPGLVVDGRVDRTDNVAKVAPNIGMIDYGEPRSSFMTIRGIGSLSAIGPDDASVTTYVGGIPVASMGTNLQVLDVERIEVLRGPQGTLFGRNTSAGAINVVFRAPDDKEEGTLRTELGSDLTRRLDLTIGGRAGEGGLPYRLAFRHVGQAGFVDNLFSGTEFGKHQATAGRFSTAVDIHDRLRAEFFVSGEIARSEPPLALMGVPGYPTVALEDNEMRRALGNVGMTLKYDLAWATLTSVTGYGFTSVDNYNDTTEGVAMSAALGGLFPPSFFRGDNAFNDWKEHNHLLSQELRLSSQKSSQLKWIAGLSVVHDITDIDYATTTSTILGGGTSFAYRRQNTAKTTALGAFGEVTVPLSGGFALTAGLRGNHERKSYDAFYTGDVFPGVGSVGSFRQKSDLDDSYLTGRAALSYAWNSQVTSHAGISRSYKTGGFPIFSYNAGNAIEEAPYEAAQGWSYELGTKAVLAGGSLILGGALFYNDINNEHVIATVPAGSVANPFFIYIPENLDVESYGFELEGQWKPLSWLTFSANLGYTHAEIAGVPATSASGAIVGNRVPNVPQLTSGLAVDWHYPLDATLNGKTLAFAGRVSWQHVGGREIDSANTYKMGSADLIDAKLGFAWGDAELYTFGTNLLDDTDGLGGVSLGSGLVAAWPRRGRVVGLGASIQF